MLNHHVYNYGIIGNGSLIAYINRDSSVDWFCSPDFAGDAVFANLLSQNEKNTFCVFPANSENSWEQSYNENTNILKTICHSSDGAFEVIDFCPRFWEFEQISRPRQLIRIVRRISGKPQIFLRCRPASQFGQNFYECIHSSYHLTFRQNSKSQLRLTSNLAAQIIEKESHFVLHDDLYFILGEDEPIEGNVRDYAENALRKTSDYWQRWVEHCRLPRFFAKEVIRSALILKLHQFDATGAIIAAGTSSLPEHPQSGRNWDYRYCWLRDSYFTLNALQQLNHFEEALAYSQFIENIASHETHLIQPLYSIHGEKTLDEFQVDLPGYLNNSPVRVGNAAYSQIQNDAYGQALLALSPLLLDPRLKHRQRPDIEVINKVINFQLDHLETPDAGIWEFRGRMRVHCNTLLFAWMGGREILRLANQLKIPQLVEKSLKIISRSAELIESCFDQKLAAYTTSPNVPHLNASELLLITSGYLDSSSEKAALHLKAIEQQLIDSEGFVFRYKEVDDFGDTTSSFMICNFWYAETLATMGHLERSVETFKLYLSTANHLGLLSEDVDPKTRSQWGNFPQTYSHVGVINTAFKIQQKFEEMPLRLQDEFSKKFNI